MTETNNQSGETLESPDYTIIPPANRQAIMYEVMIPKKIHYFSVIEDVLESLFEVERIKDVPSIKFMIDGMSEEEKKLIPGFLEDFSGLFQGYSMYEVDGRFLDTGKPPKAKDRKIDERVIVIRFYFVYPKEKEYVQPFRGNVAMVFHMLIGSRLFKMLPDEKQIWITETVVPTLTIYEREIQQKACKECGQNIP